MPVLSQSCGMCSHERVCSLKDKFNGKVDGLKCFENASNPNIEINITCVHYTKKMQVNRGFLTDGPEQP